jgi:hypothetical protein
MNIDKQRLQAVLVLRGLGYEWDGVQWQTPHAPRASNALLTEANLDLLRRSMARYFQVEPAVVEPLIVEIKSWGWF